GGGRYVVVRWWWRGLLLLCWRLQRGTWTRQSAPQPDVRLRRGGTRNRRGRAHRRHAGLSVAVTSAERALPLFPLEQVVLFPGMALPLRIFEERYKVMIGACQVTDRLFGVLLIRSGREVGEPAVPERVGCTARIMRLDRLPDGQMNILTVGEQRFRLLGPPRTMPEGYLEGDVRTLAEAHTPDIAEDLLRGVSEEFEKYQKALRALTGQQGSAPPDLPREPNG